MKKYKDQEEENPFQEGERETMDNLVYETKMRDTESNESRSIFFSAFVFIILFLFWPLLKFFNCRQLWVVYNIAFCIILIFVGVLLNVFPPIIIAYLMIIYIGIILAEIEGIYRLPGNNSITSVINACYSHTENLVFLTGGSYTPDNPDSITYYNVFFCLLILVTSAIANGIYYMVESKFTVKTYITLTSLVSLCMIFIWKILEIFYAYKGIENKLNPKEEEMAQFLATYDPQRLLKVVQYFRKATKAWKKAEKLLVPIEFSHTLSLLYLLGIIIIKYIVVIDNVTNKLGTGSYLVNDLFPDYGFKSVIFFLLAVSLLILVIKIRISYSINNSNEKNLQQFKNVNQQLDYLINIPQSFILLSSTVDKNHITISDIKIVYKDFREAVGTDCPLARLVWKQIKEEEDLSDVRFRVLREYCSKHSTEFLNRFRIVEKEYHEYYSLIEYKFFGFFEVNKGFVIRVSLTLLTTLATVGAGYIVNHSDWNF